MQIWQSSRLQPNGTTAVPAKLRRWLKENGGVIDGRIVWLKVRKKPRDKGKAVIEIKLEG